MARKLDHRLTLLLWILLLVALFLVVNHFDEPVERVLFSVDVPPNGSVTGVEFILDGLAEYNATATFFLAGDFALAEPALVRRIAERHEVACFTMTAPRLPEINETRLQWEVSRCKETLENLTGQPVHGFRAPYGLVDKRTHPLLQRYGYAYDASVVENYGWFSPPPMIAEMPVSSLGPLPLHDTVAAGLLGDLGYFLMRRDRDATVSLTFDPGLVYEHRGAFQYLLYSYADDGVPFVTHREAIAGGFGTLSR